MKSVYLIQEFHFNFQPVHMNHQFLSTLCSFIFGFLTIPITAQVYVKADAVGANNGSSWDNAYTDLQTAIAENEGKTLWVAAGIWHPGPLGSDETATFTIDDTIQLYGGFAGTEDNLSERDITANPTILSGDLNNNDVPDDFVTNKEDNVQTILTIGANINNATIIDGFTFMGGHADGTVGLSEYSPIACGGAIYCEGVPIVRNCSFFQNYAEYEGGAFAVYLPIGNVTDTLQIDHCSFLKNKGKLASGGLYFASLAPAYSVRLSGSVFTENTSVNFGGAAFIIKGDESSVFVEDCQFTSNKSAAAAGLFIKTEGNGCSLVVSNCSFTGNSANSQNGAGVNGGGLWCFFHPGATNCDVIVDSCLFYGNIARSIGGGIAATMQSLNNSLEIRDCHFENNAANDSHYYLGGGGLGVTGWESGIDDKVKIVKSTFTGNLATQGGGGICLQYPNNLKVEIEACTFTDNGAAEGQAIFAASVGGGVGVPTLKVENCLFTGHHKTGSPVITNAHSVHAKILGCTIADNTSIGISQSGGFLEIQNTLLHNPEGTNLTYTTSAVSLGGNLLTDDSMDDILIANDIKVADPHFAGVGEFPYQLSENSNAINAGVISSDISVLDLAGNPRIFGTYIDIGAFEYQYLVATKEASFDDPALTLSPNPVGATASLLLDNDWQGTLQVRIVNVLGQVFISKWLSKSIGKHYWEIDVSDLESGTYLLLLSNGKTTIGQQFVKI